MGRNVVAVIDDGIHPNAYPFLDNISAFLKVEENGNVKEISPPTDRKKTHGTLCAAIIRLYAPQTPLVSIQVLNPYTKRGTPRQVKAALEWCANHAVPIINLSIGSTCMEDQKLFQPVIARLLCQKCAIIAAFSNDENFSILTDYTGVISVQKDSGLENQQFYANSDSFLCADFCASSRHHFPLGEAHIESIISQNSHAAPVLTAQIFHLMEQFGQLPLGKILQKLAHTPYMRIRALPDFLDTAVCIGTPAFPKEILSFSLSPMEKKLPDHPYFCAIFPKDSVDMGQVTAALSDSLQLLRGVLYAGNAPLALRQICREAGCPLWDEGSYAATVQKLRRAAGKIEIPVIAWQGEGARSIFLMQRFQQYLLEKGYRSKAFSNYPQSYCCDMIFVPHHMDALPYIQYFVEFYQLDILMTCAESVLCETDIVATVLQKEVHIAFENRVVKVTDPEALNHVLERILVE